MGWTYYTDRREIEALCTYESPVKNLAPIKCCKVGSTWYVAVRVTGAAAIPLEDKTYVIDGSGTYTFAAVILTGYDDGCWGYKDMEEGMGPVQAKAPLSLLALLSEIKDPGSYAHGWRQKCRNWAAIPDYEDGDKIKLANPVTLTDGSTCQIVTATHYMRRGKKRRCYKIEESGGLVRLSKECLAGSDLLSSAKTAASPVLAEFFAGQGT